MATISKKKIQLTTARMIDNDEAFDAIQTGLKTASQLPTKDQRDKVNTWYNLINKDETRIAKLKGPRKADDLTYYARNNVLLYRLLRNYYVNDRSFNKHLDVLYHVMLAVDKDKYKQQARNYILETKENQAELVKTSKKQILSKSEKSHFVCFDDVERKRDEIFKKWMDDPTNVKLNMQHLILALYTYLPPVRDNYREMKLISSRDEISEGNNYLLKIKNKYRIIIDNDKVKKNFETDDFDLPTNEYIDGESMTAVLDRSFEEYPRKYVLTAIRGKDSKNTPMSYQSLINYLATAFDGKHVYINILRKSYVNHFYDQSLGFSYATREDIAARMRHGADITEQDYSKPEFKKMCKKSKPYEQKIDVEEETAKTENVEKTVEDRLNAKVKTAENKGGFDLKGWGEVYREKNRTKINDKARDYYNANKLKVARAKLIANLNNGTVKAPRTATIEKYDLKFNVSTDEYY